MISDKSTSARRHWDHPFSGYGIERCVVPCAFTFISQWLVILSRNDGDARLLHCIEREWVEMLMRRHATHPSFTARFCVNSDKRHPALTRPNYLQAYLQATCGKILPCTVLFVPHCPFEILH